MSSDLAHHEHAGTGRMFTFDADLYRRLIGQEASGAKNLSRVDGGVKLTGQALWTMRVA